MKDLVYLGPTPPAEPCVEVGEDGYELRATEQCNRYVDLIRKVVGQEPKGARLKLKWQAHDLGSYVEVVCEFDDSSQEAFDYAFRCESEGPQTWDGL